MISLQVPESPLYMIGTIDEAAGLIGVAGLAPLRGSFGPMSVKCWREKAKADTSLCFRIIADSG